MFNKLAALLLTFAVFLSGCVGQYQPAPSTAPPTTVPTTTLPPTTTVPTTTTLPATQTVQTKEFRITIDHNSGYSPNKISVNEGDTVKILVISNQPSHNHGITIDAYSINKAILKSSFTNPDVIEFVADKSGTFEMYCKTCETGPLGAHSWMKGTLEVK